MSFFTSSPANSGKIDNNPLRHNPRGNLRGQKKIPRTLRSRHHTCRLQTPLRNRPLFRLLLATRRQIPLDRLPIRGRNSHRTLQRNAPGPCLQNTPWVAPPPTWHHDHRSTASSCTNTPRRHVAPTPHHPLGCPTTSSDCRHHRTMHRRQVSLFPSFSSVSPVGLSLTEIASK